MAIQLVVKHEFADYAVGDHITDPAEVAKWGASHPDYVVRKFMDDPKPAPPPPVAAQPTAVAPTPTPAPQPPKAA